MANYKGMRWLKCDLQVQTPEDAKHWQDQDLKLLQPRRPKKDGNADESDIQEKARKFLHRCHELELELIGLTDHNFSDQKDPRDWFSVHLVEQNKSVARELNRTPLIILPGFEVDIGYHVLCLFEPAKKQKDLEYCNTILTKLGLAEGSRFDQSGPKQLRHNNQRLSLKKLLEIVQNEHHGIVIAAHADQAKGLLSDTANREDYAHPDLYCVELTQNPPSPRYKEILTGKNSSWSRKHSHPAWIMSSDAKSISKDKDGQPNINSLGYRYTWIKMSNPSVESLRQAFLDHDSRIDRPLDTLTDKHPARRLKHAEIKSISIKNVVFLANQEIHFSANMNCVIGGRGSGKSTLLEYLRVMFKKDKDTTLDYGTNQRIKRIKDTLSNHSTEVTVSWVSASGVEDKIIWQNGNLNVQDQDLPDPDTYFDNLPVSFYSQQQLNRLTDSVEDDRGVRQAQQLMKLVDGFAKSELNELSTKEESLKNRISSAFSDRHNINTRKASLKKLQQEKQELERQWKAQSDIQEEADKHQLLKLEEKYISQVSSEVDPQLSEVIELAKLAAGNHFSFTEKKTPHHEWFTIFDQQVKKAKEQLAVTINTAVTNLNTYINELKNNDPKWEKIKAKLDQADEEFSRACAAKGLTPDDVGHLQEISRDIRAKEVEIIKVKLDLEKVETLSEEPEPLIAELHKIWKKQFEKREEAAKQANDLASLDKEHHKFVEVSAKYQQDFKTFNKLWESFSPKDGRSRLGRNWNNIGQELYEFFSNELGLFASPWELLKDIIDLNDYSGSKNLKAHLADISSHIETNPTNWEQLYITRVNDTVDMKLFRPDGTLAGSISEGSLSDGQRNTAALALLLAQDGGPLIIDQPEDELDSNFVFNELIPMLRNVKKKRQLIMATHNANLPVNGDAELVCAFEAREGRGEILSLGGLDHPSVTKAVLDIMEGTEEAFRRRREKYHF